MSDIVVVCWYKRRNRYTIGKMCPFALSCLRKKILPLGQTTERRRQATDTSRSINETMRKQHNLRRELSDNHISDQTSFSEIWFHDSNSARDTEPIERRKRGTVSIFEPRATRGHSRRCPLYHGKCVSFKANYRLPECDGKGRAVFLLLLPLRQERRHKMSLFTSSGRGKGREGDAWLLSLPPPSLPFCLFN